MLMSRKIWLALAVVALIAASFAASVVAAKKSSEDRVKYITRGLDYLHARQTTTGGFGSAENTAWAVLGAVASGERMDNSAWHVKGENPYDYLQSTDLVAASSGIEVTNAPVYYSHLIMAYVAMDRAGTIGTAGSKGVNLWTLLLSYQDKTTGAFAPSLPSLDAAVRTTSWAILAMNSGGISHSDANYQLAETWLAAQQNGNGGFPGSEHGGDSDALDTALAYQALKVSSNGSDWLPGAAQTFLKSAQKASGGFSATPGGNTDAEATSAGIQMIVVVDNGDPNGSSWRYPGTANTPVTALHHLLEPNGSYRLSSGSHLRPVIVTSWALAALNHKPFTTYPRSPGSEHKAFRFRPVFNTTSPKNGAKFKTHSVLIRATYTDFSPKGTGIEPSACRLYVDNENRSRAADINKDGLHLQLKNVPNGNHTYRIELRDFAGNLKAIERKFVVAVPAPTPTYTPPTRPTSYPTVYPTVYPTHTTTPAPYTTPTPTPTPTPYETITPYPYTSPSTAASPIVTGSPIPSPSASASPAGAGGSGGGGSAAGFVGGTLLAMLPIGAAISYLLLHRREEVLGTASQGTVLAGGGSTWERFKQTLARSKDLTRPSPRE
jgi:hypothetical protein